MSTTQTIKFKDMPTDYAELAAIYMPRPLHNDDELAAASDICFAMAGYEDQMTPDQVDYLEAVATFIDRYEEKNNHFPELSGLEMLKAICENRGLGGADIARILGVDRTMGPAILRGDRNITADHARRLGEHFSMDAGAFIRK